jgi:hypothetical protein
LEGETAKNKNYISDSVEVVNAQNKRSALSFVIEIRRRKKQK